MGDLHPLALAGLTGFLSGVLLCIPVGPINLTIINEAARTGFKVGLLIGLGSTLMEVIYCAIAFTGFSALFDNAYVKASMELFSFVFMLYLGTRFLLARSIPGVTRIEARVEQRLHPHSAFMTGFVRTLGNPGVLLFWIILAANFTAREWVQPNGAGKLTCVGGVGVGTGLWFVVLSWMASLGHGRLSEKWLLRIEHLSGLLLLGLATAHGLHIAWQMAKEKL